MTATDYLKNNNVDFFAFFKTFAKDTADGSLGGMNAFLNKISTSYKTSLNPTQDAISQKSQQDQILELKKDTYYNIKSIYDKVSGLKVNDTSSKQFQVNSVKELSQLENINVSELNLFYNSKLTRGKDDKCLFVDNGNNFDLYKIFQVVDRGNNDISTKVLANLSYLYNNLYSDFLNDTIDNTNSVGKLTNYTMHNLLSGLAKENGFLFQQIPTYLNLNSVVSNTGTDAQVNEVVDQLFGVHTNVSLFGDLSMQPNATTQQTSFYGGLSGFPGYIFQLGSVTSSLSGDDNTKRINNNNLDSFCLDVKMNNNQVVVADDNLPPDIRNSNVTSFTVDFGKQNQQMFTSIDIDTSQFMWTENSIKTWVDYIGDNKGLTQGTNLFPIFEKVSYTCVVNGLGNATIQPLTYFYLRNVPLFHGTYWITNVMHKITPNTMLTSFKGVRQPIATKNDVRLELLGLFKETAQQIKSISNQVNTIVTEGIQDTGGIVRKVANTGKAYPDFIQKNATGFGFTTFEGKTLLGGYIFSITGDNNRSAVNMGLLATLYNSSKGLNSNTEDHATILAGMIDVAVGNMMLDAARGGTRYDDNVKGLSLSKLFKLSGNGFNVNGDLSTLLDDISKSSAGYKNAIVVPKNDKAFTVKAAGKGGANITRNVDDIVLTIGTEIPLYNNFDLVASNLFVETTNSLAATNRTSDTYPAIPNVYTLFDIFNSLSKQDDNLTDLVKEVVITGTSANNLDFIIKRPVTDITLLSTYNQATKRNAWVDFINNTDQVQKNTQAQLEAPDESGIVQTNALKIYYNSTTALIKFALLDSDGTFDITALKAYLMRVYPELSGSADADLNRLISYIAPPIDPTTKKYYKALFYDFSIISANLGAGDFLPITGGDQATLTNYFTFTFNGTNYAFSSGDSKLETTVENAYRSIGTTIFQSWSSNSSKNNITPAAAKVKYKGTYQASSADSTTLPSVVFFQTTYNGVKSGVVYDANIIKYYMHTAATVDELNQLTQPKAPIAGSLKATYQTKVIAVLNGEYNKWNTSSASLIDTNCTDTTMTSLLDGYWKAAKSSLQAQGGCGAKAPWSAAFISYIMKNSGVIEFPYATSHNVYIKKARDNKNTGGSYSWYGYDATTPDAKVGIGDLLCYTRDASINVGWNDIDPAKGTATHCDCVVAIDTTTNVPFAKVIGGNVSDSVKDSYVFLNPDGTIDLTNAKNKIAKIYRGVLKYQPAETTYSNNVQYATSKTAQAAYDSAEAQEPGFKAKVQTVASQIGAQEMDLVQIMYKESAGTLNSAITNGIGCVGLIQFCPDQSQGNTKTIGGKTYLISSLKSMSRIQQMDVVQAYFQSLGFSSTQPKNIGDLYCAVFYPAAIGKPANFVIGSEKTNASYKFTVAKQNPGIAKASNTTIDGSAVCTVEGAIKFITA